MLCFTACYVIALVCEFAALWAPWATRRWNRLARVVSATAGLVAHTWFLGQRVAGTPQAPLTSHQDWYLLAAWVVALVYLATKFYRAQSSLGLFLMPVVLALVGAAQFASSAPLATFQAPRLWGRVHGVFLMLGTVAVLLGFLAGLMYLLQSYRLKRKLTVQGGLRLPSLEWLERVNSRALIAATLLVGGGFFTGVLSRLSHTNEHNFIPWADPVVWSLLAMLVWLVLAEVLRLVYPAARQGRKVAYLTMAAFVFLLFVLLVTMSADSLHMASPSDAAVLPRLPAAWLGEMF